MVDFLKFSDMSNSDLEDFNLVTNVYYNIRIMLLVKGRVVKLYLEKCGQLAGGFLILVERLLDVTWLLDRFDKIWMLMTGLHTKVKK